MAIVYDIVTNYCHCVRGVVVAYYVTNTYCHCVRDVVVVYYVANTDCHCVIIFYYVTNTDCYCRRALLIVYYVTNTDCDLCERRGLLFTMGTFHLTGKTGIASIDSVAVNGKNVADCRFW